MALLAAMPVLALGRAALLRLGLPDTVAGPAFAGALLVAATLAPRPVRPAAPPRSLVPGLALGATVGALLAVAGSAAGHPFPAPAAWAPGGWAPWTGATVAVVVAEELFLRARVQPLLRASVGAIPAIWLTAAAFALAHAPLYGAQALPLDLGVGVVIGTLREWSGRVAPAVLAHGIADLAWWFLG